MADPGMPTPTEPDLPTPSQPPAEPVPGDVPPGPGPEPTPDPAPGDPAGPDVVPGDPVGPGTVMYTASPRRCDSYKVPVSYSKGLAGTASLTVCSVDMEHYRSTLATTAVAVAGLLVAAHVLHPGNYEQPDRRARVVTVAINAPSTSTAWADPPGKLHGSEPALVMANSRALLSHHLTVALPPGVRSSPRLSGKLIPLAPQGKAAEGDPIGDLIRNLDLNQAS